MRGTSSAFGNRTFKGLNCALMSVGSMVLLVGCSLVLALLWLLLVVVGWRAVAARTGHRCVVWSAAASLTATTSAMVAASVLIIWVTRSWVIVVVAHVQKVCCLRMLVGTNVCMFAYYQCVMKSLNEIPFLFCLYIFFLRWYWQRYLNTNLLYKWVYRYLFN